MDVYVRKNQKGLKIIKAQEKTGDAWFPAGLLYESSACLSLHHQHKETRKFSKCTLMVGICLGP